MKIYIVAHKNFNNIAPHCYYPIKVGKDNPTDNTGDNISERNNQFCELTAQYWIWKNDKESDITGLVHYRRYFVEPSFPKKDMSENILSENTIRDILSDYDVILPELAHKMEGNYWLKEDESESNEYLSLLRRVIEKSYSEYLPSFDKVAYKNRMSFGNMLIAKKEIFDDYSAWLFDVLDKYEKSFPGELPPRHLGYMAEYLLNTYFWTKKLKVKYLRVVNIESDSKNYIKTKMILSRLGIFDVIVNAWYLYYEQTKLRKRT